MIPNLVRVQVRQPNHRTIRIWIPVLPVLIILSPLLLLAAIAGLIACVVFRIDPVRALVASFRLLCAVRGMHVEVDQPDAHVLVDIR